MKKHDDDRGADFGTGLRAHIERRDAPDELLADEPPAPAAPEPQPQKAKAAALEERIRELAAIEAELERRERRIAEKQASLTAAELRAASAVQAEQETLAEAPLVREHRSPVDLLRERAEQEAELLWRAFHDSLEATHPDGAPDFQTRLLAASELLAVTVTGDRGGEAATPLADELARMRERRVKWGQSS
jgi:type IV secretory pathway VirB10-like protein